MNSVSKQEVGLIVDSAKNHILDRMITRAELISLTSDFRERILKDLRELHQENHQVLRQNSLLGEQYLRRAQMIETRLLSLESNMKQMQNLFSREFEHQNRSAQTAGINLISAFKRN